MDEMEIAVARVAADITSGEIKPSVAAIVLQSLLVNHTRLGRSPAYSIEDLDQMLARHRPATPEGPRISIKELRAMEAQVAAQPADGSGTMLFLKEGMLAVIRSALAAEKALSGKS